MPKRDQRPDPIRDYIEWTNHRFDPGYYLGGNLPPTLRKASLGPKGRRLSGIALAISAVLTIGSLAAVYFTPTDIESILPRSLGMLDLAMSLGIAVLLVWAAAAMLHASNDRKRHAGRMKKSH